MKYTSLVTKRRLLGSAVATLFGVFATISQMATQAAETAHVVKYGQNDIVPVKAKLRFSTLIILPEKEEILDLLAYVESGGKGKK